ncbi:MAG: iron ABC transporter substrate-binding protein, partial [Hyphomicrobiales bacterium]
DRGYLERLGDGTYLLIRLPGEAGPGREAWGTILRLSEAPLRDAVAASNETGFLAITEKQEVRYLTKVLPAREIRYDRDISKLRKAHQVASGIVMLAGLEPSEFDAYLGHLAPELRGEVAATVAAARVDGFCVNLKGVVEGAAGIAAPVRDAEGRAVAAINISGPRDRIEANVPGITGIVVETARLVSEALARRSRTSSKNPGRN